MEKYDKLAHSLSSKERSRDVLLNENIYFSSLILPAEILKALTDAGFEKPSPIQVKALPIGRCGLDIIVKSKSGTGKTLVFGIISLESIKLDKAEPQVLILAPTREIAVQIQDVIRSVGKYHKELSVECFIGGLPISNDKAKCKGCHIAVGTPGRVKELILGGSLSIEFVKIFVLDEADKLTEDSFQNDINEIYNALPDYKQIIMCSATYPDELQKFLEQYMRSPVIVSVELETPLLLGLRHYVRLQQMSSNIVVVTTAKNQELLKILSAVPFVQCVIFANYQNRAETLSYLLNKNGWNSIYMSAAQKQIDRLSSFADFKNVKHRILVTTDLSSRGIDAPNLDLVINYDIPASATTYLHRMGRAGRYGSTGNCINMAFTSQETLLLQTILGFIGGEHLSIPILNDRYVLDMNAIPKDRYLFGIVKDTAFYNNEVTQIRTCLVENYKEKSVKNKKKSKPASNKQIAVPDNVVESKISKDVHSTLNQLASGCFESNESPSSSAQVVNNNMLNIDPRPETSLKQQQHALPNQKVPSPSLLLKQIAEGGDVSSNSSSNTSKDKIFATNKALVNVAKMLCDIEVSSEDYTDLETYLCSNKRQENLESKPDQTNGLGQGICLENIFGLAYKSQISAAEERWQNYLSDEEKKKLSPEYQEAMNISEDSGNQDENPDNQSYDEDYDFEVEKEIQVNCEVDVDDYSFMKWIPVEPQKTASEAVQSNSGQEVALQSTARINTCEVPMSTRSYDPVSNEHTHYHNQYSQYFNHSSSNLWQNGLRFQTIESFDQWFYNDWEQQLATVRNFVQNKIYVEEMSHHD
ncbi:hypothetical protein HUJ04_003806 [Dendroctonus ponderosae]|uniref:RNA helicase n=2 Tax=Dendroctonus ponderosae TaxID=77166 RepID=A0AAR5P4Q0_DENPD|nr:hypothetical protein HUJ04_003806 [Dendroctonus ponderosae]